MFLQSFHWGGGCESGAGTPASTSRPAFAVCPSTWQPKVNTSLQNPSALPAERTGGEACIDHSDKHLTLQEHMLSLLKLLIALNIFSYCGWFATNCSLVGRCCPPQWGPLTFRCCRGLAGGLVNLPRRVAVSPGLAAGSDLGGGVLLSLWLAELLR